MIQIFNHHRIIHISETTPNYPIFEIVCTNENKVISYFDSFMNSSQGNLLIVHPDIQKILKLIEQNSKFVEAAGGYVVNDKNESLVIYRNNKWDLPKGKIEKDEKIEHAALREVQEECGISNVQLMNPIDITYHLFPWKNRINLKKTYWFKMLYNGNEKLVPQLSEGIIDAKWISDDYLTHVIMNTFSNLHNLFNLKLTKQI